MPRVKEPVDVLIAKGRSHLSREEILTRRAAEAAVIRGDISAPDYLSDSQAAAFDHYAGLLDALGVMSELYSDLLARYVIAQENYILYEGLANNEDDINLKSKYERLARIAFEQAHKSATQLGLTPSSRQYLEVAAEGYDDDEL